MKPYLDGKVLSTGGHMFLQNKMAGYREAIAFAFAFAVMM